MSVIPEVKCRRCGAQFSSMRSRCPSCGTRRVSQSGRTPSATPGTVKGTASYERAETNTRWQMIFGLILVVAVILAIIVMVSTSLSSADNQSSARNTPSLPTDNMNIITPEPPPATEPPQTPSIESVELRFLDTVILGDEWNEQNVHSPTLHLDIDETVNIKAYVYPMSVMVDPSNFNWSVNEPDVVELIPQADGSCNVHILQAKAGGVMVTVEVFGVQRSARFYCVEYS